jgi:RHS repeat-associated protein
MHTERQEGHKGESCPVSWSTTRSYRVSTEMLPSSYYRARYYDQSVGRFLGEDPLMFSGGGSNFYAYVGNSPTAYTDPYGFDRVCSFSKYCPDVYNLDKYTPTDSLPSGSVQYTSPSGTTFWVPPNANWCEEYADAQASRYRNPIAIPMALAQGGTYDYQRDPVKHMSYQPLQQAANYSVGVYMQGYGFSRSRTIDIALKFAKYKASNYSPQQIEVWKQWWGAGWDAAKSGAYSKTNCDCK